MTDTIYTITDLYHCPKCGSTEVSYYEEVYQYWNILGTTDSGTVLLDTGNVEYGDADGSNARFSCYNCNHNWPATETEHRFVWDDEFKYAADFYSSDEPIDFMSDAEADADVLRMAGMGTDEDYGGYDIRD